MIQSKRDAIVEQCLICGKTKAQHNGSLLFCPMYATFRPALAKQQGPAYPAEVEDMCSRLSEPVSIRPGAPPINPDGPEAAELIRRLAGQQSPVVDEARLTAYLARLAEAPDDEQINRDGEPPITIADLRAILSILANR